MADQTNPLVITMWETYGSNMEAVANELAAQLKLPIHKQAYSSEAIEEAMAEREKEGTLGRLLRNFAPTAFSGEGWVSSTASFLEGNYAEMAERNTPVVEASAAQGGIIMGRNGQFILKNRPNTLHVKLDGPVEDRVKNAEAGGLSHASAAHRQVIEDEFRSQLSMKTYHFDPRDPEHYDLIVNSAKLPVKAAAAIIRAAAEAVRA
ncbi:MAG: cytidylate kinase-like family protein [Actinomycetes bacterium]